MGELVRAHRKYTGLSQRAFAEKCGLKEKSLSDIEVGRRDMPDGFLDTVEKVLEEFDADVEKTIDAAAHRLKESDAVDKVVHFDVSEDPDQDWVRAVIGRAAVTSGLIVPRLPAYTQS